MPTKVAIVTGAIITGAVDAGMVLFPRVEETAVARIANGAIPKTWGAR